MNDLGRIKNKTVGKVLDCMTKAKKAVSIGFISKTAQVNYNMVERIMLYLEAKEEVWSLDSSLTPNNKLYILASEKNNFINNK
jgi:hypothetical protein